MRECPAKCSDRANIALGSKEVCSGSEMGLRQQDDDV